MRAIQFSKFGNPAQVLAPAEVDAPPPGPGEVKIKVNYANINYSDVIMIKGEYGIRPSLPSGCGSEGCGIVEATGDDAGQVHIGDKVAFFSRNAAWAEYVIAKKEDIIKLAAGFDDQIAAQLFTNPLTAEAMLEEAGVKEGDVMVVNAAASSVGKLLIQLGKLRGARTIAIVRNEEVRELLTSLGADGVINSETENVIIRTRQIAAGTPPRVAFDAVAGPVSSSIIQGMADDGIILLYGALSKERIPLNATQAIFKGITIKGFWLYAWVKKLKEKNPEALDRLRNELSEKISQHNIRLPVDASYGLSEISDAMIEFEKSNRRGKILIKP